jgi:hypothetical protein
MVIDNFAKPKDTRNRITGKPEPCDCIAAQNIPTKWKDHPNTQQVQPQVNGKPEVHDHVGNLVEEIGAMRMNVGETSACPSPIPWEFIQMPMPFQH